MLKYFGGRKITDKLAKVKMKDGTDKWILIHIEIQSSFYIDFSLRMFVYYYHIFDRYFLDIKKKNEKRKKEGKPKIDIEIEAIVIYTSKKIPKQYDEFFKGSKHTFIRYKFRTYKIRDAKEEELLKGNNPFSLVVLASKYELLTRKNYAQRHTFKKELVRLMRERKYNDSYIHYLFKFIKYIVALPKLEELKFNNHIDKTYKMSKSTFEIPDYDKAFALQLFKTIHGIGFYEKLEIELEKGLRERTQAIIKKREETMKKRYEEERKKIEEKIREKEQESKNAILNLLELNLLSVEQIAKVQSVPIELVLEIKKWMTNQDN